LIRQDMVGEGGGGDLIYSCVNFPYNCTVVRGGGGRRRRFKVRDIVQYG
jgi:hypothetical protein